MIFFKAMDGRLTAVTDCLTPIDINGLARDQRSGEHSTPNDHSTWNTAKLNHQPSALGDNVSKIFFRSFLLESTIRYVGLILNPVKAMRYELFMVF